MAIAAPPAASEAAIDDTYAAFRDGHLIRVAGPDAPLPAVAQLVHDSFRALVLDPRFSCLGARSAVGRGRYRTGFYDQLGTTEASDALARDLRRFLREQETWGPDFSTFVASFAGPTVLTELAFEQHLWTQLRQLHGLDRASAHTWDPSVSSDPAQGTFAFSFAGRAFFIVGLHAASSRWARRFAWPTLVFNTHEQFRRLRANGHFGRMQQIIRAREQALQGSLNPNLSEFGVRSEARQYSGRAVDDDWRCPFPNEPVREP